MPEPKWMQVARGDLGLREVPGRASAERIMRAFNLVGLPNANDDVDSWCSAMTALWMKDAGEMIAGVTAAARSWLKWGRSCEPQPGCIVVLWRDHPTGWQGHVGLLVSHDGSTVKLLAGNQGNAVSIASFPVSRVLGYRWPAAMASAPVSQIPASNDGEKRDTTGTAALTRPADAAPPPAPKPPAPPILAEARARQAEADAKPWWRLLWEGIANLFHRRNPT